MYEKRFQDWMNLKEQLSLKFRQRLMFQRVKFGGQALEKMLVSRLVERAINSQDQS
jgi:hypothetical protein